MTRDGRLYHEFFNVLPALASCLDLWVCLACFVHVCKDGSHRAFVALVFVSFRVLLKVFRVLVDCVVGKVHEKVV